MARQPKQAKNLSAALGTPDATASVFVVWFGGIGLGVLVFALIAGLNIFGGAGMVTGNRAAADFNDYNQVLRDNPDYTKMAEEGQSLFQQKCQLCHAGGGRLATGIGPRLDRSQNARDMAYIHTIVRQGACGPNNSVCGMPYFKKEDDGQYNYYISDNELYKVVIYLRTIKEAPRGEVASGFQPAPLPTAQPK